MQNKERDILASLLLYFLFYYYCAASQLANAQLIDLTSSSGLLYLFPPIRQVCHRVCSKSHEYAGSRNHQRMVSDFEQKAANASYLYFSAFVTFATPPDDGNTIGLRWRGCHNSAASFVTCAAGFPPSLWRAVRKYL